MNYNKQFFFENAFNSAFGQIQESVLDFPNGKTLCSDIWVKDGNSYKLKDSILQKVREISEYVIDKMGFKNCTPVIVGSICSNSYSDESDIDIHFELSDHENKGEEFMRELNKKLEEIFDKKYSGIKFDSHPVECFAQQNRLQDIGSVGAYDIYSEKWLSGPQILDTDFDPYSKYFDSSLKRIKKDGLIDDISKMIFDIGIISRCILNVYGRSKKEFISELEKKQEKLIDGAKDLFKRIRLARMAESSPKTEKEALEMRTDRSWKENDASFKFMDKMGFLAVLKDIRNSKKECKTSVERSEYILKSIKDKLFGEKVRTGSYGTR